ncbi:hydrogen peroxide-inducible genes activator [Alkalimarinus sediminis]|uniref:LysR substrate-binding domain-containing protein n=1 Tax=Alkalimarinus sediminis TaxID=1632866 RepID=A0A9E8HIR2_9ALTE|nr:hydrogen peroxide-inducible genes activator [Alkalimarinus sediminis]UZW75115.1 LysR substrate-binding domain-containing protein [Alkalimarinus sediminis]
MITTKQLSYALAVEKTLHFKKAAESCNISQSALSTALSELEKQLGLQIFERDNKKVLVTPVGKEILEKARAIMLQIGELQHLADNQQAPLSFPISVGVIPTIAPYLLPKLFPLLAEQYPQAQINIVEEQSHVLVDLVKRGEIDTAILAMPFPCEGLLALEFWQEDFYWIALKGEKHTNQKEITSNELTHSKLMLLKEGHCLKDHILAACKLPEQTANHGFGATSLNTLVQMVLGKMGSTLIPKMALEQLTQQHEMLSAVHLNEPSPHRRIAFIIRPNYTRMSSVEALIKLSKSAL